MKIALLIVSALLFYSALGRSEEPPTLVRAVVIDLQKVPEEKLSGGGDQSLLNQRVLWKAFLKIDAVYQGPANINGETMDLITSDHTPYGNIRSITPKLQMGDTGIFAIEPLRKKGEWRITYLQPVIYGAALPLIKGRQADYDRVLLFLSDSTGKTSPASIGENSDAIQSNRTADFSLRQTPILADDGAPEEIQEDSANRPWWLGLVAVALLVLAIVFGRRRFKSAK